MTVKRCDGGEGILNALKGTVSSSYQSTLGVSITAFPKP